MNDIVDILSSRSKLCLLTPLGLGEAGIESATGYIARCAEAKNITPQTLIEGAIFPQVKLDANVDFQDSYRATLYCINGLAPFAQRWIPAIEKLSKRKDIRYLTMLPWQGILPWNGLVSDKRRWCPKCFQEAKDQGKIIYEQLLWSLVNVKCCPKHLEPLAMKCPYCSLSMPTLASRMKVGHCSRCNGWLGSRVSSTSKPNAQEIWNAKIMGEWLSYNSHADDATIIRPNGSRALNIFKPFGLFDLSDPQYLSEIFGVHKNTILKWKREDGVELSSLLKGCYALDISPISCLPTMPADPDGLNFYHGVQVLPKEEILINLYQTDRTTLFRSIDHFTLYLCNVTLVIKKMGCRPNVIRESYPHVYKLIKDRFDSVRPRCIEFIRTKLQEYRDAPERIYSMTEIGLAMKMNLRYLRMVAPDICSQISKRRADYEARLYEERVLMQEKSVRECCEELKAQNKLTWPRLISTLSKSGCLRNPRLKAVAASYF